MEIQNLLCRIGWHHWGEPYKKYLLRSTGLHFFLFSEAEQLGKRQCQCCGLRQWVARSGFYPGEGGKWRFAHRETRRRIRALPVL